MDQILVNIVADNFIDDLYYQFRLAETRYNLNFIKYNEGSGDVASVIVSRKNMNSLIKLFLKFSDLNGTR